MARVYMLLFALEILLAVLALISCLSAYEGEVRVLPRIVWVIIILLFPLVGSIAYFAAGRPLPETRAQANVGRPGPGVAESERPRQLAPDDDPAFLKAIDAQTRRSDEEILRRWEEDLRRREDELRKKDDLPPSDG
jgi:hypothetical protein